MNEIDEYIEAKIKEIEEETQEPIVEHFDDLCEAVENEFGTSCTCECIGGV
jgi:hypothetical protein